MDLNKCNPILSSFLSVDKQGNGPRLGRREAVNDAQSSTKTSRHADHIPTRWLCQCSYALDHSAITLSYYFSSTTTQTTCRYSVFHEWPACKSLFLLFSWSLTLASKNVSFDWLQEKRVGKIKWFFLHDLPRSCRKSVPKQRTEPRWPASSASHLRAGIRCCIRSRTTWKHPKKIYAIIRM